MGIVVEAGRTKTQKESEGMKGIMFNYDLGMHHAVLRGIKDVTRRIGKLSYINDCEDLGSFKATHFDDCINMVSKSSQGTFAKLVLPAYLPGEIIYVKEPVIDLKKIKMSDHLDKELRFLYQYPDFTMAGESLPHTPAYLTLIELASHKPGGRFKNKMFMGAEEARHFLQVKSFRAERLKDITEDDSKREGIIPTLQFPIDATGIQRKYKNYNTDQDTCKTAKESYLTLFQDLNGVAELEKNPWLFRYEFQRIEKPKNLK
jgi:hypothetical protein